MGGANSSCCSGVLALLAAAAAAALMVLLALLLIVVTVATADGDGHVVKMVIEVLVLLVLATGCDVGCDVGGEDLLTGAECESAAAVVGVVGVVVTVAVAAGRLPPSLFVFVFALPRTRTGAVDMRSHWRSFSRSISKPGEGRPSAKKGCALTDDDDDDNGDADDATIFGVVGVVGVFLAVFWGDVITTAAEGGDTSLG